MFTGSKDVGMHLIRDNAARPVPRPLIIEMGGKNPALVMKSADLDKASDGVMRSAFGAQGQKCSACSRVYVSKAVRDEFVRLLVEKTKKIKIGNPLDRDVYLGPVINEDAVKTYERAIAQAKRDGGKVLTGGRRITDGEFAHGYFVEPTLIDGLPTSHPLFSEELFVPITVIGDVATLDEAIDLANRSEYGLTAGIFSEDDREIEEFFNRVQAGVTLRESPRRRDDRRVAGHQFLRRLEGERLHGARHRRAVLRPAVHEGTEPGANSIAISELKIEDFRLQISDVRLTAAGARGGALRRR